MWTGSTGTWERHSWPKLGNGIPGSQRRAVSLESAAGGGRLATCASGGLATLTPEWLATLTNLAWWATNGSIGLPWMGTSVSRGRRRQSPANSGNKINWFVVLVCTVYLICIFYVIWQLNALNGFSFQLLIYAISAIKNIIFQKGNKLLVHFKRPVLFSLVYLGLLFKKKK